MPYYATPEMVKELIEWIDKFKEVFNEEIKSYLDMVEAVVVEQQIRLESFEAMYGEGGLRTEKKRKQAVWIRSNTSFEVPINVDEGIVIGTMCSNCGSQGASNYIFCPMCGSKMLETGNTEDDSQENDD